MESLDAVLQSNEAEKYEPSSHCKTLIMRTKKKQDNGLFSWDDAFYKSNFFWFYIIMAFELVGIFVIILTSLESGLLWLGIKVISILLLAIVDYLLARETRKKDNQLNLHKTKDLHYKSLFEIYDKKPEEQMGAKDDHGKSQREIRNINGRARLFLYALIATGLAKCVIFFLDYFATGNISSVLVDYSWLTAIYCGIYLTVPFLHWFFYSYLYWIEYAYSEVKEECKAHYVNRMNAIDRKDRTKDVNDCKRVRPFSFDVSNLKPDYSICQNYFEEYITNPKGFPGIMTDDEVQERINIQKVSAATRDSGVDAKIFTKFLSVQFLKFTLSIAENTPESGVGHYDENIRDVKVNDANNK